MTEPRRRYRRPPAAPVLWGSIALFAVLFALLTYQLSSRAAGSERRQVVVHKVIAKRVVKTIVPAEEEEAPVYGAATGSTPEVEAEAPEAPEYVAPEPAPVVTASS